jgi:AsmA protein
MNTLLKVIAAVAAVVVVLLVAVALWVALIFEPNDFRPLLVNAVERNTGRSLAIEGDLGLSLFPCCSVTVGPSTLGNPEGFPDDRFARLNEADLSLKVWPLITRREVQIGTVTVDGLDLSLVRLADGRANWEFVDPAAEQPEAEPAGGPLDGLSIAGLRISDARVTYRDLQADQAYTASSLQLRTGAIAADLPFPFEARVTVQDESDGTEAQLNASGTLSLADDRVLVRNPRLEVAASGPAVPARRAQARVQGDALDLSFADVTELVADALRVTFDLTGVEAVAGDVNGSANVERLQMNLDALTGTVTALTFEAAGLDARARGTAAGTFDANAAGAEIRGTFELEQAAPRRLLALTGDDGYRPAHANALNRLAGTGRWALAGDRLVFDDVDIVLDDSRLTGTASLENFGAGAVQFDLLLDRIDIDRYAPAANGPTPTGPAAATEPTVIPLGELAGLDLDGRFRIGQLQASGVALSDVRVTAVSRAGNATVGLQGQGMGGRFQIDGSGNVAAAEPQLRGRMTLENLSPRQLLTALGTPPDTADPNALASLAGTANWRLGSRSAGLESIAWQLDDTRLTGSLGVDDLDALATRFDLSVDRMDLDRYLPAEQADAPPEQDTEIPIELIRDLNLNGRLAARQLTVYRVPLQNVQLEARGVDGVLRLDPLRAGLYGGEYQGTVTVDATGPTAILTLDQQVSTVQIGELLRTFYDTERIDGALSLSLAGRGSGATVTELLRGLAADFSLNLRDGMYRGMDLLHEVQRARAALRSERLPAAPEEKTTPLRALSLSGRMVDGVLTSERLSAETDALRLSGRGGFNVIDFTLDYRLDAQVQRDVAGLSELAGVTLPLTIQGPMMSPRVGVDLTGAAASALRERAEDRAREALLRRLGGDRDSEAPAGEPVPDVDQPAPAEQQAEPAPEARPETKEESPRDLLRRGLRDLIKPQE